MKIGFIANPFAKYRVGELLIERLRDKTWLEFRASVAFVKRSGTKHIKESLSEFCSRGGRVKLSVGIDAGGTSFEGLADILEVIGHTGDIFVYKNAGSSTFHPKVYVFRNNSTAEMIVGSCNLTEGGLFTNYEASFVIQLNLSNPEHATLFNDVIQSLDSWSTPTEGLCYPLNKEFLSKLVADGFVPMEVKARGDEKTEDEEHRENDSKLFTHHTVPLAPKAAKTPKSTMAINNRAASERQINTTDLAGRVESSTTQRIVSPAFLMTLQNTDVGVGQTTAGTSRRSPEIFIPLKARDHNPEFWGWPHLFTPDENYHGKIDRNGFGKMERNVTMQLNGETFPVRIWYNPNKKDLRLSSEQLRSAGSVDDILYIKRSEGRQSFDYDVAVVPQDTALHSKYSKLCTETVRNSKKKFGYV